MGLLLVCVGELGLSCEECLVWVVKKSGMALSYGDGFVLSARSGRKTREMRVEARDRAFVAGELRLVPYKAARTFFASGMSPQ